MCRVGKGRIHETARNIGRHPLRGATAPRTTMYWACALMVRKLSSGEEQLSGGAPRPRGEARGAAATGKTEGRLVVEALPQARHEDGSILTRRTTSRRHPRRDPGLRRAAFGWPSPRALRGRRRVYGRLGRRPDVAHVLRAADLCRRARDRCASAIVEGLCDACAARRRKLCRGGSRRSLALTHRRFRQFPQKAITQATHRPGI